MHDPPGDHITVCICTYKRGELLRRLLDALTSQETAGAFTYSVVVADNDRAQSGRKVTTEKAASGSLDVVYCVEPEQNIALARNKALSQARGTYIAFIDDDEVPGKRWLLDLYLTCRGSAADGVLGPVKPYFEHHPPAWLIKGKFCERPTYPTGYRLKPDETRSGNVLFKREIITGMDLPFRPEFGSGSEDVDFFSRMMNKGHVFVWCHEAAVHELVPPSRCTRSYYLKRALLRGGTFPKRTGSRAKGIARSMIAIPLYTLMLPFCALSGQHILIRYLVKLFDHGSRILAVLGVKLAVRREA